MIRSRTPRTETGLNIFGIIHFSLIASTAASNSSFSWREINGLGRCGGGRVRPERRRQLDASSDPLALRDRVDEIGVEIAQQFAIYEELASLLWLHYAGWEDL